MPTDLTSFTGKVGVSLQWTATIAIVGQSSPMLQGDTRNPQFGFSFGTGVNQVTNPFFTQEVLTPSQVITIDLYSIIFPQSNFNLSMGFATVKLIEIELDTNDDDTTASGITIGGALVSPFNGWLSNGGTQTLESGGLPYLAGSDAGRTVSPTIRYLQITNLDAANNATVNVTLFGIQIGA